MENFNVETASLQEAMDYAVMKIVEQGGRCMSAEGGCAYGNSEGKHCAVGWLLDANDEELMASGQIARDLAEDETYNIPSILRDNPNAFQALQRFHDVGIASIRSTYLRKLEDEHKINTSAPHWQQWVDMGKAA